MFAMPITTFVIGARPRFELVEGEQLEAAVPADHTSRTTHPHSSSNRVDRQGAYPAQGSKSGPALENGGWLGVLQFLERANSS